jgi:hypothetical protein
MPFPVRLTDRFLSHVKRYLQQSLPSPPLSPPRGMSHEKTLSRRLSVDIPNTHIDRDRVSATMEFPSSVRFNV